MRLLCGREIRILSIKRGDILSGMTRKQIVLWIEFLIVVTGFMAFMREYWIYRDISSFWAIRMSHQMNMENNGVQVFPSSAIEVLSDREQYKVLEELKINVNTADNDDLQSLPRIGPKTASRIIEWRKDHKPFQRLEDLLEVKGIGPATLQRLEVKVKFTIALDEEPMTHEDS